MTDLHTKIHGTGPRLFVGLHGWNGTTATFDPLVDHLPDDATLLAVDLPGYGRSPAPDDWTLQSVGASVARTVQAVIGDTGRAFSVVGSCSGAIVGLSVARAAGAFDLRVERHVMLEPFAYVPWYLRLFLVPAFGRLAYWSSFGTRPGRWITNTVLEGRRGEDTDMMSTFADSPIWVPYRYLELFDALGTPDDLPDVPGHKHLVYGAETFQVVRNSVSQWTARWPDATVDELPDTGHLVLEEAPARVAALAFETGR